MSDLLQTIAAYVPPSIVYTTLAEDRPAPPLTARVDRLEAALLFADVSGFTPLTETLARKGAEGPEELTRLLNSYFSRMIALLEAEGGEVVKFSGDAVTVVFPVGRETLGHAVRRARQAAEAIQAAMNEFTTLSTSIGPVALRMKIGIGAGQILAAHVGGIFERWEYVIAGDVIRQVTDAEDQAKGGEIVLSPEAEAIIFPAALPPRPLPEPDWTRVRDLARVEAVLRCYIPGAITGWLQDELQDWVAVLRPMSVLFIRVNGLDYAQATAVERLHTFLRSTQEIIYSYEGSINKLAVDDKGTISIALFGAPPFAHEDDAERAIRCALDLQAMAKSQNLQLAIGVTTGRVFAGPVGSETRREYTVMGDTVNLAARLMSAAGLGEVRCDYETRRLARGKIAFEELAPVYLKGKAGLFQLYRPAGNINLRANHDQEQGALVGRQEELATFMTCLDAVEAGRSRILVFEGEAGIGKSRLVEEFMITARACGVAGLLGMGRSIEQQTPYRAWRDIFAAYFILDGIEDAAERRRRVQRRVQQVAPDLVERMPLLNDMLNLGFPENELTASLDTEIRHDSLDSFLLALLRAWAEKYPLCLVLEDAHWLDALSWDLILQVARALTVAQTSLLLVIAMRPLDSKKEVRLAPSILAEMEETEYIRLDSLTPQETVALATARLGLPAGGLPEAIADLVRTRAGGNPFFAEELIYTLRDNGLLKITTVEDQTHCQVRGDLDRAVRTLPDTIQGIVLSRIDRLPPEEQLTLKVAAVIGRTFAFTTLYNTLNRHTELTEHKLKLHLDDLRHLDLTPLEALEPELTYIFKHIITQEVAYETLLFSQRRQLHRTVAQWYERKFGNEDIYPPEEGLAPIVDSPLVPYYPLLVYHWRQAEDKYRERHYAWLAGNRASAQFANADAANYFTRALALSPDNDLAAKYELLLAREAVNDRRGEREAQAQDIEALVKLTDQTADQQRRGAVALRQANYAEAISDYPEALVAAQRAAKLAQRSNNQLGAIEGYIAWGRILWRQGNYEHARKLLKQALDSARDREYYHGEAKSLHYLGHAYRYQNSYLAAQECYQQALEIYRAYGHRQGEADCLNDLGVIQDEDSGNYSAVRSYYEQALAIFHMIGDRRGESITLGNLGNVYCDLGDFVTARAYQEQALELRRAIGDRWGEAISLTNLGLVNHSLGDNETARIMCEQALVIQQEIGDRSTAGYSLTYLGHALSGLGEFEAALEAYEAARALRHELGQHSAAIDDLAGLAYAAMKQNETVRALTHVREILEWLDAHGPGGIEYPFQVYLTCYQVLISPANGDQTLVRQAKAVLAEAHTALMAQAANISDSTLRRSFLKNISANREILAAWQINQST